jgi:hypothetical protein
MKLAIFLRKVVLEKPPAEISSDHLAPSYKEERTSVVEKSRVGNFWK